MTNEPPIRKRLKELRTEAGLSQKKLGMMSGIDEFSSSARVNQYEKGKHIPDYSTVQRFAKVLDVPACYFYTAEDEMAEMIQLFSNSSAATRKKTIKALKP